MKGIVVTTDDQISIKNFDTFLEDIRNVFDGYPEIVYPEGLSRPYCMAVDDEGLLKHLPLNKFGSYIYQSYMHGSPIVGDVVIVKIGMTDGGPDVVGLEDHEIDGLKQAIERIIKFLK